DPLDRRRKGFTIRSRLQRRIEYLAQAVEWRAAKATDRFSIRDHLRFRSLTRRQTSHLCAWRLDFRSRAGPRCQRPVRLLAEGESDSASSTSLPKAISSTIFPSQSVAGLHIIR